MPFLNSDSFNAQTSRLAVHFDPILAFFVPLYLIHPSVGWLIFAQALALSMACWPIFFLAKKIFVSEKTAFIWAVVFSFNPFILNAAAWDFHPVTLAVPFIAASYLALEMKKFSWLLICTTIILLCKEHFGLLVIGFGILWGIKNREWKPGLFLIALGAFHMWLVFYIIIPHFSPTGRHLMLSEGQGQLSRYAWLGQSIVDVISFMVLNPFLFLKTVLFDLSGFFYLFLLLLPFLGFSLAGLPLLLPAIADLSANMLSNISMPRSPMSYHSATLIPIFTAAAIYGVKKTGTFFKKFSVNELTVIVLICSFVTGWFFAPLPIPGALNYWAPKSFITWPDHRVQEIRSLAGSDASISVQANIGAHFSQRKEIYRFPSQIEKVDLIVLRLDSPTTKLEPHQPGPLGSLADHLQMDLLNYLQIVEALVWDDNFYIHYWNEPWLVFSRGHKHTTAHQGVLEKLYSLKKEWLGNKKFD